MYETFDSRRKKNERNNHLNFYYFQNSSSKDSDEIIYRRKQPLIWRIDRNNITEAFLPIAVASCRNSVQGRTLIVDEEGFVCTHLNLQSNGCCKISKQSAQYDCNSCVDDGCCAVFENCVSCCLNPTKRTVLEKVLESASGRQSALFATVRDQFELCLAKCRTDSHSVQHENKYKNPDLKHCYGLTEAHESLNDVGRVAKVL